MVPDPHGIAGIVIAREEFVSFCEVGEDLLSVLRK